MSKKISELPAAGSVLTTDILPVVAGGVVTDYATVAMIGDANHPGLNPALIAANATKALTVNAGGTAIKTTDVVAIPVTAVNGGTGFNTAYLLANPSKALVVNAGGTDIETSDIVDLPIGSSDIDTTLSSKTLANPTITGTVIFQGTRMRILSIPGEVQTTDDTVTTVVSFAMVDETVCAFDVVVTACLQGAATDGGRWKRSVVYRRTSAGVPLIVGTLETGTDQEVSAGLDVTVDDDGVDTVRVRVTGLPSVSNMNWTAELRVQETLATA